jgi:hypothetical protein
MKLLVSVDREVISKGGGWPLCIEFEGSDHAIYAKEVYIPGPCTLVYKPDEHDPGDPKASCWIEVEGDVICR